MFQYIWNIWTWSNIFDHITHSTHFESCQSRRIRHQSKVKIEFHRQETTLILNYLRLTNVTNKKTIEMFPYNFKHFCCWVRKIEELWMRMLKHFSWHENLIKNSINYNFSTKLFCKNLVNFLKNVIIDSLGHWSFKKKKENFHILSSCFLI